MKHLQYLKSYGLCLFMFCFVGITAAQAQPRRGGGRNETPKILKDLPTFFVNDNVLPPYLKKIYQVDATRLAIRLLSKEQRAAQQTVKVPEDLVQSIYNALVAVRTSDYGAVDSISRIYYIRSFPNPNVERLTLMFEHDAPWIEPLKRKVDTTGSPTINRLIREHNLVMTKMVYVDEERGGLTLQSREPINIGALSNRFFADEGVLAIEETLPFGDGNDISISRTKDGWEVVYSLRFGNCVTQCDRTHDWKFSVSAAGEVRFLGSEGQPIPPWIANKPTAMQRKYPDVLKK